MPLSFGADAVYIGGEAFGLRAKAENFSMEDMKEGIAFAHEHGVKVYVTANIPGAQPGSGGRAGIFQGIKRTEAGCADHRGSRRFYAAPRKSVRRLSATCSTQANNTNYLTYQFLAYIWERSEWLSARELSLEEIREIRAHIPEDHGDRDLYPRRHVHFLFRALSAQQLSWPAEMPTREPVPIPVAGNIRIVEESRPGEYHAGL